MTGRIKRRTVFAADGSAERLLPFPLRHRPLRSRSLRGPKLHAGSGGCGSDVGSADRGELYPPLFHPGDELRQRSL